MRRIATAAALAALILGTWSTAANAAGSPSPGTPPAPASPGTPESPGTSPSPGTPQSPEPSPTPGDPSPEPPRDWIRVTPSRVAPGGTVHVTGRCNPNETGYIISQAFVHDAQHDFAGVGAVDLKADASGRYSAQARISLTATPGVYHVGARCGGGNAGGTTLTVVRPAPPVAVPAGSGGQAASTATTARSTFAALAVFGLMLLMARGVRVARSRRRRC